MPRDYARKQTASGNGAVGRSPSARAPGSRASKPKPGPRRQPARGHKQSGGLSVRWILSLAAVGGFIGFIVYLNTLPPDSPGKRPDARTEQSAPTQPSPKAPPATTQQEPKFRFYDILPDTEVVPPEVEEYAPSPTTQDFRYVVQAGSFRTAEDAERQRAQIAFQGLRAQVDRINLDSGATWYRVNVGPFESRSQMNSAVDKLVAISVQPLVRKVPK